MNDQPTPKEAVEKPKNVLEKQLKSPVPPIKPPTDKSEDVSSKPPNKPVPSLNIPKTESEVWKTIFVY